MGMVSSTTTRRDRAAPDPAPQRILIVEDQADSRECLRRLLERGGHRVDVARDGFEGVELALAHRPTAAVLDIGLPGLDGHEVARRLRAALGGTVFLIAYTAYGRTEERALAREAGFDLFLVKPDGLRELLRRFGAG